MNSNKILLKNIITNQRLGFTPFQESMTGRVILNKTHKGFFQNLDIITLLLILCIFIGLGSYFMSDYNEMFIINLFPFGEQILRYLLQYQSSPYFATLATFGIFYIWCVMMLYMFLLFSGLYYIGRFVRFVISHHM